MATRTLPYQHLSVRVPWHDTGWEGSICSDPLSNGACLRLGRIAEGRDDLRELGLAGKSWDDLAETDLPPCTLERAGLMSSHGRTVTKRHPYAAWNDVYRKFRPTSYNLPAHSADCIPFRWMIRKHAADMAEQYQLPYEPALEDSVDREAGLKNSIWVQDGKNQQLLLDAFFSAIRKERSLFFVYAKEASFSTDPRRILIGVGRTTSMRDAVPYLQDGGGFGSVLWERVIGHSIRPTMDDGFLLPYHELLRLSADQDVDPEEFAVYVPDEFSLQFSYASEHVSHDAALSMLLALDRTVQRLAPVVAGSWTGVRDWMSARIGEVWQARGPYPGLGAALTAFGLPQGVLLSFAAQSMLRDNEDPWAIADQWLRDPSVHPEASARIPATFARAWAALSEERRSLLKLISRFDLTIDQATRVYQPTERQKAGIDLSDAELLANPYRIYECDRFALEPTAIGIIDRGMFPDDRVRAAHPVPAPSKVDDPVDPRRVRTLVIDVLEHAAAAGHCPRLPDTSRARDPGSADRAGLPGQRRCHGSLRRLTGAGSPRRRDGRRRACLPAIPAGRCSVRHRSRSQPAAKRSTAGRRNRLASSRRPGA